MLEHFLVSQVFAFLLIFCRIGSGIMVMPGFRENYVSPRIRLGIALMITLIITPLLSKTMPSLPSSLFTLVLLAGSEILIGIFIGSVCNIIISATHVAGMIFSFQSGISSAVIFDATQNSQGSLVGNFLGLATIVLLFSTNLHHLMVLGLTKSYTVFIPGQFPPMHDFLETLARIISDTFIIALQISMPFIIAGTLLFLGGGILSRLMPTIQVFFLITPVQLLIGFFMLMAAFSTMMLWYMEFYKEKLMSFTSYIH